MPIPSNVWLALSFEGGYTDQSSYAHAQTDTPAQISTGSPSRTGDTYASTTGTLASLNYDADLNELNGLTELTVEFDIWVPDGISGDNYFFGSAGNDCWNISSSSTGTATVTPAGSWGTMVNHPITFSAEAWHHLAWSGSAAEMRSLLGGATQQVGTGLSAIDFAPVVTAGNDFGVINVATRTDLPTLAGLRIDNLIITKAEKYTDDFIPPANFDEAVSWVGGGGGGSALPTNVVFALNFEAGSYADKSIYSVPLITTSGASISSPSRTGDGYAQSSYLNDTGSGLGKLGYSFDWSVIKTGDVTIEFDLFVADAAALAGFPQFPGGFFGTTGASIYPRPIYGNDDTFEFSSAIFGMENMKLYPEYGRFNHIALVLDEGVTYKGFVGGVLASSLTSFADLRSAVYDGLPDALWLLKLPGLPGPGIRIDNVMITKSAKYTADFTPPDVGIGAIVLDGAADLDDITSTGSFEAFNAFTGLDALDDITSTGSFTSATPAYLNGDISVLDDILSSGVLGEIAPASLLGSSSVDGITSSGILELVEPNRLQLVATVPAATLVARATQFLVNAVVPAATLQASMSAVEGYELDATVPSASLSAWTGLGLHGTVPAATITASATVVDLLRVDAQLPRVTLESALSVGNLLSLVATVPAATVSAWTGAQVTGIVPAASLSASATTGMVFTLVATVPAATASIGASSVNVLRLSSDVPAVVRANWTALSKAVPAAGVLANVTPVVAITRVAYSFTLANSAMTRYPAYPFIQIIRMGNTFYGVAEDGLHEIGGTTDNATPIAWTWETCMSDFGQPEKKTPVSAYLGGYVPASMTYTIRSGDSASGTAAHATTATAVLRNHRQKLGLGRKSRFFAFGLAGSGQVSIESIEFEMATMSRRI